MTHFYEGNLVFTPTPARTTARREYFDTVDAGGGLTVHRRFSYSYEPAGPDDYIPFCIRAEVSWVDDEQHYDIDEVNIRAIDGGPRTVASYLRLVPLVKLAHTLACDVVMRWPEPFTDLPDNRINRKVIGNDDAMARVALVHRVHEILPANRATTALAEHYDVSTSTARRWIRETRARGLMRPETQD